MSSTFRPRAKIQFPNGWALNSFLLKLKRNSGHEYMAAMDGSTVKLMPKGGGADYILIGLNKTARNENSTITIEINAERMTRGADALWTDIYTYARLYRI